MARKIYLRGGLGVDAFRRIYGGSKRNGSRPPHFRKSNGAIARLILQQLQSMSIVDIDPKGSVSYSKFNKFWALALFFIIESDCKCTGIYDIKKILADFGLRDIWELFFSNLVHLLDAKPNQRDFVHLKRHQWDDFAALLI